MALVSLAAWPGQPDRVLGVVCGGLLAAVSYRGIKGGIDVLVGARGATGEENRPGIAWPLVKFFTRYAIVALAAYVILVRLRLPPVGVLTGASSMVVAAAVEAIRSARPPSRADHPRQESELPGRDRRTRS